PHRGDPRGPHRRGRPPRRIARARRRLPPSLRAADGRSRGLMATSLAGWKRRAVQQARVSRKETLAFIKHLSREEMLEPRTQDAWSVKDVLGHFMACDEETVRRLRHIAAGHAERIKWFESLDYANRFNARTVAGARRLSLAAVLKRMARARADLVKRLERL